MLKLSSSTEHACCADVWAIGGCHPWDSLHHPPGKCVLDPLHRMIAAWQSRLGSACARCCIESALDHRQGCTAALPSVQHGPCTSSKHSSMDFLSLQALACLDIVTVHWSVVHRAILTRLDSNRDG